MKMKKLNSFKSILLFFYLLNTEILYSQNTIFTNLDNLAVKPIYNTDNDWLINSDSYVAGVYKSADSKSIILTNGLIQRVFRIGDFFACYSLRNLVSGHEYVRAIMPEVMLTIDNQQLLLGGVSNQFERGYINESWFDGFVPSGDFELTGFNITDISPYLEWKPAQWIPAHTWPPKGKEIIFKWAGNNSFSKMFQVEVHYEIYDGLPLISKWIKVINNSSRNVVLNSVSTEILAMVEEEVSVDKQANWSVPDIFIASDYSFMGMTGKSADRVTHWLTDSSYTSQVNYELKTPCLLVTRLPDGPEVKLQSKESTETFRIWELLYDSDDKERKGLSVRRFYRVVSPWVLENPIFMHLTSTDEGVIKTAVDQCKATGFEMIILSFGSGLDMESTDEQYIQKMKSLAEYSKNNGVELGGYSLLASRKISDSVDVINPKTMKTGGAVFGNSPCLGSNWGKAYFENLTSFMTETGFSLLEHDGSYPGDFCASTNHPGHRGLKDSQWTQWKTITDFYKWCRSKDIYLNVPDWYFLSGSNKTGIGYRETNWSLPRDRQLVLGRQNIYDGTWEKTPSMGWTFVPLVQYQGGGEEATLEPLSQHLHEYEAHLFQNFGSGVQACYRGYRLYDTVATKQIVIQWVNWYKKYREILNSDIIHLRRADGRDWDGIMHVNPNLQEKALILLFNPLKETIEREISVPLYYTGIKHLATVSVAGTCDAFYTLNEKKSIKINVKIPANGFLWLIVK